MPADPTPIVALETPLGAVRDKVLEKAGRPGARVLVRGGAGSGRTSLARLLGATPGAILVEPPDVDEPDAVGHAAVQLAVRAGADIPDAASSHEVLARALAQAAASDALVVARLPSSWAPAFGSRGNHDERSLRRRTDAFVRALARHDGVRLVLLADGLPRVHGVSWHEVPLPKLGASAEALEDAAAWGTYAGAASALRAKLQGTLKPNPLALRLAVGAVALGGRVQELADRLRWDDENLAALVQDLAHAAARHGLSPLLQRYRLLRHSLPAADVLTALEIPNEHAPLVTACLGYVHEGQLRVPDAVRAHLGRALSASPPGPDPEPFHLALADAHERYDGVADPRASAPERIVHALERAHQLANAGRLAGERWDAIRWLPPEALVDRARRLSLERRFDAAAALYRRALAVDPSNDYAHHYLAFNLDRIGREPARVEAGFREAVRLDPANGWWNARLVTFLVEAARYPEASEAYLAARRVLLRSPAYARAASELAFHAASAWLRRGEVSRARLAFDDLSPDDRPRANVRELEARLVDAEDVVRLGDSVRPPTLASDRRWSGPAQLPPTLAGVPLTRWYAGRVAEIVDDEIRLVVAAPPGDRILLKRLARSSWAQLSRFAAEDVLGRFVEIGEYGDRTVLEPLSHAPPAPVDVTHELRYLSDWA